MDWSNRFTLGGFTVTYCTFQMAWEVIEKRNGYEVVFRWFYSRKKAEGFLFEETEELIELEPSIDIILVVVFSQNLGFHQVSGGMVVYRRSRLLLED